MRASRQGRRSPDAAYLHGTSRYHSVQVGAELHKHADQPLLMAHPDALTDVDTAVST